MRAAAKTGSCGASTEPRARNRCISSAVRAPLRPISSNSRRSWFDDTWMSIDGLNVGTTSSATSEPFSTHRARMSLRFDPMMSWSIRAPIFRAYQPARMLPKLPVGTENAHGPTTIDAVT